MNTIYWGDKVRYVAAWMHEAIEELGIDPRGPSPEILADAHSIAEYLTVNFLYAQDAYDETRQQLFSESLIEESS